MTLPKQKFREIVCQLLYAYEMGYIDKEGVIPFLTKELKIAKRWAVLAVERADAVWNQRPLLDQKIASASHEWSLERIQKMELSILRLGVYEILFDDSLEGALSISEARRLAKKFSTPESLPFVNGILDAILRERHG